MCLSSKCWVVHAIINSHLVQTLFLSSSDLPKVSKALEFSSSSSPPKLLERGNASLPKTKQKEQQRRRQQRRQLQLQVQQQQVWRRHHNIQEDQLQVSLRGCLAGWLPACLPACRGSCRGSCRPGARLSLAGLAAYLDRSRPNYLWALLCLPAKA